MSDIVKMVNGKLASLALLGAAVLFSYQAWSLIWGAVQPAAQEILSIALRPTSPGQLAEYTGHYRKRRDCPGTWTIRLLDSASIWHTLGDGALGANPPGDYSYTAKLFVPSGVVPGPAKVTEVQAVICTDLTHVARAEAPTTILPARR